MLSQTHADPGPGLMEQELWQSPGLWKPASLEAVSLLWELRGLFTLYTLSSCSASSHLVLSLLL